MAVTAMQILLGITWPNGDTGSRNIEVALRGIDDSVFARETTVKIDDRPTLVLTFNSPNLSQILGDAGYGCALPDFSSPKGDLYMIYFRTEECTVMYERVGLGYGHPHLKQILMQEGFSANAQRARYLCNSDKPILQDIQLPQILTRATRIGSPDSVEQVYIGQILPRVRGFLKTIVDYAHLETTLPVDRAVLASNERTE